MADPHYQFIGSNPFLISERSVRRFVDHLERAVRDLRAGKPVLLFDADDREGETDFVLPAAAATTQWIRQMREDGGGLLCTAVAPEYHHHLGLPYLADLQAGMAARHPVLGHLAANDIRYDPTKSSFGLTINHRRTFTGIPDGDRATTIRELGRFLSGSLGHPASQAQMAFGEAFRSPGHVALLNGHPAGLDGRRGHTELSIALLRLAGLTPCAALCEMLDGPTGKALSKKGAQAYAKAQGLVFLTGKDVLTAWQRNASAQSRRPAPRARPSPRNGSRPNGPSGARHRTKESGRTSA